MAINISSETGFTAIPSSDPIGGAPGVAEENTTEGKPPLVPNATTRLFPVSVTQRVFEVDAEMPVGDFSPGENDGGRVMGDTTGLTPAGDVTATTRLFPVSVMYRLPSTPTTMSLGLLRLETICELPPAESRRVTVPAALFKK